MLAKSPLQEEEVTTLSSEVVKNFCVKEDSLDKYVIDSNSIAEEKIRSFLKKKSMEREEKRRLLLSDYISNLTTDSEGNTVYPKDDHDKIIIPEDSDGYPLFSLDENGTPILPGENIFSEDGGFSEGITSDADEVSEDDFSHITEDAKAEAEKIISDANDEAARIISDAKAEGERLKSEMSEAGRQEGYADGANRAESEYAEKKNALDEEKLSLEQAYEEKHKSIEADTVNMVSDIVSKFFKIEFGDKKELLNHIIDGALLHIEDSMNFSIHVSREQFAGVNARRAELQKITGESASVDVVADPLLKEGECLIETDSGVYDCSLDTELDSLVRDLKALSIEAADD